MPGWVATSPRPIPAHRWGESSRSWGGFRIVTNGGSRIRFARSGGLTFEAGLGIYSDFDRVVAGEPKRGTAGRLAVGWQF
ncbi:MAG TPA: hypothetical protein VFD85_07835 [Gemmatimonadales bacterium]|nr:hypothetical protein [Gemmatimonadales bacterium]